MILSSVLPGIALIWLLNRTLRLFKLPLDSLVKSLNIEIPKIPILSIDNVTESSLVLHWDNMDKNHHYGVYLNGMEVAVTDATNITLNGLSAATVYQIDIFAINPAQYKSKSTPKFIKTLPAGIRGVLNKSPRELLLGLATSDDIQIRAESTKKPKGRSRANTFEAVQFTPMSKTSSFSVTNPGTQTPDSSSSTNLADLNEMVIKQIVDIEELRYLLERGQEELRTVLSQNQQALEDFKEQHANLKNDRDTLRERKKIEDDNRAAIKSEVKWLDETRQQLAIKKEKATGKLKLRREKIGKMQQDLVDWRREVDMLTARKETVSGSGEGSAKRIKHAYEQQIVGLQAQIRDKQQEINKVEDEFKKLLTEKRQKDVLKTTLIPVFEALKKETDKSGILNGSGAKALATLAGSLPAWYADIQNEISVDARLEAEWRAVQQREVAHYTEVVDFINRMDQQKEMEKVESHKRYLSRTFPQYLQDNASTPDAASIPSAQMHYDYSMYASPIQSKSYLANSPATGSLLNPTYASPPYNIWNVQDMPVSREANTSGYSSYSPRVPATEDDLDPPLSTYDMEMLLPASLIASEELNETTLDDVRNYRSSFGNELKPTYGYSYNGEGRNGAPSGPTFVSSPVNRAVSPVSVPSMIPSNQLGFSSLVPSLSNDSAFHSVQSSQPLHNSPFSGDYDSQRRPSFGGFINPMSMPQSISPPSDGMVVHPIDQSQQPHQSAFSPRRLSNVLGFGKKSHEKDASFLSPDTMNNKHSKFFFFDRKKNVDQEPVPESPEIMLRKRGESIGSAISAPSFNVDVWGDSREFLEIHKRNASGVSSQTAEKGDIFLKDDGMTQFMPNLVINRPKQRSIEDNPFGVASSPASAARSDSSRVTVSSDHQPVADSSDEHSVVKLKSNEDVVGAKSSFFVRRKSFLSFPSPSKTAKEKDKPTGSSPVLVPGNASDTSSHLISDDVINEDETADFSHGSIIPPGTTVGRKTGLFSMKKRKSSLASQASSASQASASAVTASINSAGSASAVDSQSGRSIVKRLNPFGKKDKEENREEEEEEKED